MEVRLARGAPSALWKLVALPLAKIRVEVFSTALGAPVFLHFIILVVEGTAIAFTEPRSHRVEATESKPPSRR